MKTRHIALFVGILLATLFTSAPRALAYSVETHAFLTNAVFDFYNQYSTTNKLPEEFRDFLIDGSRREDDNIRPLNHFYDPVHDRGLTVASIKWQKAKEWAIDAKKQNAGAYNIPETIASILTAIQKKSIEAVALKTSYTWKEAIQYWLDGEKEKAIFTLGHVMHLVEDMMVPEHTRNDEHLTSESPYETWTEKFSVQGPDLDLRMRLDGKEIITLENLDLVFDQASTFSNNNFYSKDTLGVTQTYKFPETDYFATLSDGRSYGIKEDKEFGDYPLIKAKGLLEEGGEKLINRPIIMSAYWSRLSTKAVQYGAGVIDLFFRDVEKAKADPNFVGEEPKSFVASALETVQNFFVSATDVVQNTASGVATFAQSLISKLRNEPERTAEILSESVDQIAQALAGDPTDGIVIDTAEERAQLKELQNQLDDISDVVSDLAYQVNEVAEEGKGGAQEIVVDANGEDQIDAEPETEKVDSDVQTEIVVDATQPANTVSGGGGVAASAPNLTITEIMYNASGTDDGREWIEVKNDGVSVAPLDDVRFLEGGTNHRLTFVRGSASLGAGVYAVIAADADQFIADHPTFTSTLFDSSFSLSNDGETLALTFGGNTFHSISYSSSTSAYGDGDSLQLVNNTWVAAVPTPGEANVAVTNANNSDPNEGEIATSTATSSSPTEGFGSYHVLISEVQLEGENPGDEFVELYNPTDAAVDLAGWSLQYAGAGSEITSSTMQDNKRNFFATSSINAKSYYLVARRANDLGEDGYKGDVAADMTHRTFSLSGNSAGARLFLVPTTTAIESESDPNILDVFDYRDVAMPGAGGGFERRAWSDNLCHSVIPGGTGEFLGNGCDTGVFADDFELRAIANPQNSASFPEPRIAPLVPSPASGASTLAEYARDSVAINFAWEPSSDFQGGTSTVIYKLTNASTSAIIFNSTSTSFTQPLMEVGRSYAYILQAFDRDGLGSATSSVAVEVPSYLDALHFYEDSRAGHEGTYLLDVYYGEFPYIPDRFNRNNWQGVVFYLNRDANTENESINTVDNDGPTDLEGVFAVRYSSCAGGTLGMPRPSLIFPLSTEWCGAGGGLHNSSLQYSNLEDLHLVIVAASTTTDLSLTADDFITVAFYSFSDSGAGNQQLSLVAVDTNRYFFENAIAHQHPPVMAGNLTLDFDGLAATLSFSWDAAADSDTLDSLLTYEMNIAPAGGGFNEALWENVGTARTMTTSTAAGDAWTIGVRAVDDFGNASAPLTTAWNFPDPFVLSDYGGRLDQEFAILCPGGGGNCTTDGIPVSESIAHDLGAAMTIGKVRVDAQSVGIEQNCNGSRRIRAVILNAATGEEVTRTGANPDDLCFSNLRADQDLMVGDGQIAVPQNINIRFENAGGMAQSAKYKIWNVKIYRE